MKNRFEDVAKAAGDEPFRAQQKWTELSEFMEFLLPRRPKNILEIGVYKGGTLMAWTRIADENARLIGLDLPGGEFGGGFTQSEGKQIAALAIANQRIDLFAADSHDQGIVESIQRYAPFDFIFIDADHTYEGVKADYENYFPMLAKGGVMAFHDVAEMSQVEYPNAYVYGLWKELKEKHNTKEFIDLDFPTDHGIWGGIGVIIND